MLYNTDNPEILTYFDNQIATLQLQAQCLYGNFGKEYDQAEAEKNIVKSAAWPLQANVLHQLYIVQGDSSTYRPLSIGTVDRLPFAQRGLDSVPPVFVNEIDLSAVPKALAAADALQVYQDLTYRIMKISLPPRIERFDAEFRRPNWPSTSAVISTADIPHPKEYNSHYFPVESLARFYELNRHGIPDAQEKEYKDPCAPTWPFNYYLEQYDLDPCHIVLAALVPGMDMKHEFARITSSLLTLSDVARHQFMTEIPPFLRSRGFVGGLDGFTKGIETANFSF